jgi:hypothetical protein
MLFRILLSEGETMTSMMVSILALQLLPPVTVAHLDGPIASAVTREAVRIAEQPPSTTPDDWSRVGAVPPGTHIALTRTTDSAPLRRLLVGADDRGIVVLDLNNPALPKRVARTLASLASARPGTLVGVLDFNDVFDVDDIHLEPRGLFLRGTTPHKLADRAAILTRVPREEVAEVVTSSIHGSAAVTSLAAAGGALFGWYAAIGIAWSCECSGKPFVAMIGIPIAVTSGVYASSRKTVSTVVYRATDLP